MSEITTLPDTMRAIPQRFASNPGDEICAAMKPMMEMLLGARLTFAGHLDADVLARATRLLLDLEPVLGCWPHEGFKTIEWVRCNGLDERPACSLAETTDPDRDLEAFYSSGLTERGPRLAVRLLRSADRDDVCVILDHLAGDGWSVKEVTHLLAETYSRLLIDPEHHPIPRGTRPGPGDSWEALTDEQRAVAKASVPPIVVSKVRLTLPHGTAETFHFRTLPLPPEKIADLREYAHARGASVNDTLVAAIARSLQALYPQKPGVEIGVALSADVRRLSDGPALRRIANISTVQTALVKATPTQSFAETLAAALAAIKPYRDSLWSVGMHEKPEGPGLWGMRAMFSAITAIAKATHSSGSGLVNLGSFDDSRLLFGEVRPVAAYATGEILRYGALFALASSYRGTMTLCMGFREKHLAPHAAEQFLARVQSELDAVIASQAVAG
jgi:NRPS condensation-like uncharacterized protein